MDDDSVNRLIGQVYDASYDRARWQIYLESLRIATGSMTTSLIDADVSGVNAGGMIEPFISPEANRLYQDYYCQHDEYALACMRLGIGPGRTWSSHQIIPDAQLEATEFYDGWLRKFDYFYTAGALLFRDGTSMVALAILRSRAQGEPDETTIRLMTVLMQHHQRALLIDRRLRELEANDHLSELYANALPYGVIAIDRRGRVLSMNRMAAAIANAQDGILLDASGISALRSRDDGPLRRAIGAALAATPTGSTVRLPRPGSLQSLVLIVAPLPRDDSPWHGLGAAGPAALIFVHDAERQIPSPADLLRRLYDLTPQQARLASLLGTGVSIGEAADQLGITRGTATSHLKQIFRKTGIHRQSALIRLLMSLPPDLRGT